MVSAMYRSFQTATHLERDADILRRRRYGVIEMREGKLVGVRLRPWPKWISLPEVWLGQRYFHRRNKGDHCWLYYNEPFSCPGFLALPYVVSSREATLASFHGALVVLDEIARLKDSNAIVCHLTNGRISSRLMRRWGWEQHLLGSPGRHYIKRFYGEFCDPASARALMSPSSEIQVDKRFAVESAMPLSD
jgi:hypothetical protein